MLLKLQVDIQVIEISIIKFSNKFFKNSTKFVYKGIPPLNTSLDSEKRQRETPSNHRQKNQIPRMTLNRHTIITQKSHNFIIISPLRNTNSSPDMYLVILKRNNSPLRKRYLTCSVKAIIYRCFLLNFRLKHHNQENICEVARFNADTIYQREISNKLVTSGEIPLV